MQPVLWPTKLQPSCWETASISLAMAICHNHYVAADARDDSCMRAIWYLQHDDTTYIVTSMVVLPGYTVYTTLYRSYCTAHSTCTVHCENAD